MATLREREGGELLARIVNSRSQSAAEEGQVPMIGPLSLRVEDGSRNIGVGGVLFPYPADAISLLEA